MATVLPVASGIVEKKHALRKIAARMRKDASQLMPPNQAGESACRQLARCDEFKAAMIGDVVIGLFHPIRSEIDPRAIITQCSDDNIKARFALPLVVGDSQPLEFREYIAGDALKAGAFGVQEPYPSKPLVQMHILIIPLLAFDRQCYRLGYGGGFYDRTLALHEDTIRLKVGIAYDQQLVDEILREAHDYPLDMVVTPTSIYRP